MATAHTMLPDAPVHHAFLGPTQLLVGGLTKPAKLDVRWVHLQHKDDTHGSLTRTRPCIETKACKSDDRAALHVSVLSPAQVPRMERQTLPSS